MNCGDAKPLLLRYADGDPEALLDGTLRAHLDECDACDREVVEQRRLIASIVRSRVASGSSSNGEPAAPARDPYSEKVKQDALALFRLAAERARAEGRRDEAPATTTAPKPVVASHRPFLAVGSALAAAAAVVLAWWAFGATDREGARDVVLGASDLASGWRRIRLETGERLRLDVAGVATAAAEGPAELDVRLWPDSATLAKDGDPQSRAWSFASAIVASDGAILDVAVVSGSARVMTPQGNADGKSGERLFAVGARAAIAVKDERRRVAQGSDPNAPAVAESAAARTGSPDAAVSPSPSAATIRGRIEAPAGTGDLSATLLEVDVAASPGALPTPRRTVDAGASGDFAFADVAPGLYLFIPNASGAAVSRAVAFVGVGDAAQARLGEMRSSFDRIGASTPSLEFAFHPLAPGASATVSLSLRLAGVVRGTVRDRAGLPVAGATVCVVSQDPRLELERATRESVSTGGDGSFEIAGVLGRFDVEARTTDGRAGRASATAEAGETRTVQVDLAAWGPFAGRVETDGGEPVAGAHVRALRESTFEVARLALATVVEKIGEKAPSATTDDSGTFRFGEALEPVPWVLVADATGFAPVASPPLRPDEGSRADVRLVVSAAVSLEGRVVDAAGRPVADGRVMVARPDRPTSWVAVAPTDDEGRFRIDRLVEGEHVARAVSGARRSPDARVDVRPGARIDLRIEGARTARVRVRWIDATSASGPARRVPSPTLVDPVLDVQVWRFDEDPRSSGTRDAFAAGRPLARKQGVYEVVLDDGSDAAWIGLSVCGRIEDARSVAAGGDEEFVLDADAIDRTLGAVRVVARDVATGADLREIDGRFVAAGGAPLGWVRFDSKRGVFGPLRAGRYELTVAAPGYGSTTREVTIVAGGESDPIEVALEKTP
ncbi:MAG TPA: carboxypeptidase-like regulatory domain-containing protein [Planctomycetota bacterium]|nr:carboxypeptidase-like regulatory domain-containing protein [Planctomycetota bacterium]